jgi:hypothetical protein
LDNRNAYKIILDKKCCDNLIPTLSQGEGTGRLKRKRVYFDVGFFCIWLRIVITFFSRCRLFIGTARFFFITIVLSIPANLFSFAKTEPTSAAIVSSLAANTAASVNPVFYTDTIKVKTTTIKPSTAAIKFSTAAFLFFTVAFLYPLWHCYLFLLPYPFINSRLLKTTG